MKQFSNLLLFILVTNTAFSRLDPIEVTSQTLRIGAAGMEELYFGFSEGDIIIFDFEEVNGKDLREIDVTELPKNSRFSDFKTSRIENKEIKVTRDAVYRFTFNNGALGGRTCRVIIHRIPKTEELRYFNTGWEWKTFYDTLYTHYKEDSLTGYINRLTTRKERQLVKVDTLITELISRKERVHSETAIGKSQYSFINVSLPSDFASPNIFKPYKTRNVIAWSYWLGVGEQAEKDYKEANEKAVELASGLLSFAGAYGAMAQLALSGVSYFSTSAVGDNVIFKFKFSGDGQTYLLDSGNSVEASGRITKYLQGGFTLELFNDNFRDGIDVNVRIVCVQIEKTWEDVEIKENIREPQYVKVNRTKYTVNQRKERVNSK